MDIIRCTMCEGSVKIDTARGTATCEYCDSVFALPKGMAAVKPEGPSAAQMVFARWKSGKYFYPGVVKGVHEGNATVLFFDGEMGVAAMDDILELEDALTSLNLEGNWNNFGFYYKGTIAGREPLVMHYNDGDVELVELGQLRGRRPK